MLKAGQGSVDMARESLHAVERVRGSGLGKGSAIKRPDAEIILSADPFLDMRELLRSGAISSAGGHRCRSRVSAFIRPADHHDAAADRP
jgi:hypothetical protein